MHVKSTDQIECQSSHSVPGGGMDQVKVRGAADTCLLFSMEGFEETVNPSWYYSSSGLLHALAKEIFSLKRNKENLY